jgi:hypothetical protein
MSFSGVEETVSAKDRLGVVGDTRLGSHADLLGLDSSPPLLTFFFLFFFRLLFFAEVEGELD